MGDGENGDDLGGPEGGTTGRGGSAIETLDRYRRRPREGRFGDGANVTRPYGAACDTLHAQVCLLGVVERPFAWVDQQQRPISSQTTGANTPDWGVEMSKKLPYHEDRCYHGYPTAGGPVDLISHPRRTVARTSVK